METIESFTNFLRKIGTPNFLVIGIIIIVLWLLISGFRKGLKRKSQEKKRQKDERNNDEDSSE
jgi:Na+/H+ antiporter NhaD/arsenite permease-like protein